MSKEINLENKDGLTFSERELERAKASIYFTPEVEDDIKAGKFLKHGCTFQAIPNPEKPGITIVDLGQVILDRGNFLRTTDGWLSVEFNDVTIEKLKCLRGYTNEGLLKQHYHIVEVTINASGKKHYAILKRGPLKALLAKHQAFLSAVV